MGRSTIRRRNPTASSRIAGPSTVRNRRRFFKTRNATASTQEESGLTHSPPAARSSHTACRTVFEDTVRIPEREIEVANARWDDFKRRMAPSDTQDPAQSSTMHLDESACAQGEPDRDVSVRGQAPTRRRSRLPRSPGASGAIRDDRALFDSAARGARAHAGAACTANGYEPLRDLAYRERSAQHERGDAPAARRGPRGALRDGIRERTTRAASPHARLRVAESTYGSSESDGAAPESNRPSRGLHDRTGFEDQLGHRAHAAPALRLALFLSSGRPRYAQRPCHGSGSSRPA